MFVWSKYFQYFSINKDMDLARILHRQKDRRTDGLTDGRADKVIHIYPLNIVCGGGGGISGDHYTLASFLYVKLRLINMFFTLAMKCLSSCSWWIVNDTLQTALNFHCLWCRNTAGVIQVATWIQCQITWICLPSIFTSLTKEVFLGIIKCLFTDSPKNKKFKKVNCFPIQQLHVFLEGKPRQIVAVDGDNKLNVVLMSSEEVYNIYLPSQYYKNIYISIIFCKTNIKKSISFFTFK